MRTEKPRTESRTLAGSDRRGKKKQPPNNDNTDTPTEGYTKLGSRGTRWLPSVRARLRNCQTALIRETDYLEASSGAEATNSPLHPARRAPTPTLVRVSAPSGNRVMTGWESQPPPARYPPPTPSDSAEPERLGRSPAPAAPVLRPLTGSSQ